MGRPIETRWSPGSIFWTVDQIVVSVGPYMFHTDAARATSASARSPLNGLSAAQDLQSRIAPPTGFKDHAPGRRVACITVTRPPSSCSFNHAPSTAFSRVAMMVVARPRAGGRVPMRQYRTTAS
jgi:hypothetical protein